MAEAKITVEASLIIPLIISIICALLYEALQSCDRCVINMTVDKVIQEELAAGADGGKYGDDPEDAGNIIREELSKKLMIYEIDELTYERKKNKIKISVYAAPSAAFGIAAIFRRSFGQYRISRKAKIGNLCSAVRGMDIVRSDP